MHQDAVDATDTLNKRGENCYHPDLQPRRLQTFSRNHRDHTRRDRQTASASGTAALIFTGGVVGVGTYYALQYGFFGLGMVLNLALLGVSRDYEAEADQLGVQYAWRAGYDPKGFIRRLPQCEDEKPVARSFPPDRGILRRPQILLPRC
jgi:hypothetical protein